MPGGTVWDAAVEPGSAAFEASAFFNRGALFIQVGPVLSWQVLISAGSPRATPTQVRSEVLNAFRGARRTSRRTRRLPCRTLNPSGSVLPPEPPRCPSHLGSVARKRCGPPLGSEESAFSPTPTPSLAPGFGKLGDWDLLMTPSARRYAVWELRPELMRFGELSEGSEHSTETVNLR